jgi:hypothetical protein
MTATPAGDAPAESARTTTLVAIGTRKGLWLAHSPDRRTWQVDGPHFGIQEVPSICIDGRGDVTRILVGARSEHWGPGISWSDDFGKSWHETDDGAISFPADTGSALGRVWQLQPGPATEPGLVYAGVEPTSLWRSADSGEHFELVRGLWEHPHRPQWTPGFGGAAVHSILVDPDRAEHLTVAMSTGGVYQSEDGGASWQPTNRGIGAPFLPDAEPEFGQCVHKIARDGADPRVYYAQNHHGVYRSDDNARTWSSIADGLPTDFGFVMLSHPRRAGTIWVVPIDSDDNRIPPGGRLRVHRSTDGGRTWAESERGLPDGCYNAVLRDAAATDTADPVGVYLGTRDGDVYGSIDGGETFETIAAHLPDVLCVRAAQIG